MQPFPLLLPNKFRDVVMSLTLIPIGVGREDRHKHRTAALSLSKAVVLPGRLLDAMRQL